MPRLISFAVAALVCSLAFAQQPPARVRGTITAVDGNVLSVKSRDGTDLKEIGRAHV